MSHTATCNLGSTGELDYNCSDCLSKKVGDLDDRAFAILMGCTREVFETFCREVYMEPDLAGSGEPCFLYNFWDAIMSAPAIRVQARRKELERRIARTGRV